MLAEYKLNPQNMDRCSQLMWNTGYKINRDSFKGTAKHRTPTQYNVYTDGSRTDDQTGTGIVIYKGTREIHSSSHRLPDYATVFQAEVTAISQAAWGLDACVV